MVCDKCNSKLSVYATKLNRDVKCRYIEKTKVLKFDPYETLLCSMCRHLWKTERLQIPLVTYADIYNYFVLEKSAYTHQEFRAYKALEAYSQFASGWVKNVKWLTYTTYTVFVCNVMHSMRLRECELQPWVMVNCGTGVVEAAHCTCVAGLGETCTHIGALLFYVMFASKKTETSVTETFAYWMLPKEATKRLEPARLADISYLKPSLKKRKFATQTAMNVDTSKIQNPIHNVHSLQTFLSEVQMVNPGSAILRVTAGFNEAFNATNDELHTASSQVVLQSHDGDDGSDYTGFNIEPFLDISRSDILPDNESFMIIHCATWAEIEYFEKYIKVCSSKAKYIFNATNTQCGSFWKMHRQLRFTGSVAYDIFTYFRKERSQEECHQKFKTLFFSKFAGNDDTLYGQKYEPVCGDLILQKYPTFQRKFGLFINTNYPWLGFSADGLLQGAEPTLIEIKCPRKGEQLSSLDLCQALPYIVTQGENIFLKKRHKYYGQIQLGLTLLGLKKALLIIYSKFDGTIVEVAVPYDHTFCCNFIHSLTEVYFKYYLPFLVSKKKSLFTLFSKYQ